jgi:membrane protease YdiL (CAAX protease family)
VALHLLLAGRTGAIRVPRRDERRVLALVATGAAVEEALWHGPAFRALRRHVGAAVATGATSLAFALGHREARLEDTAGLCVAGAVFAVLAIVEGLGSAVAAHVTYDLMVVLGAERPG